ncbi:MAG: pantetheine-phosphate adenylyltransferase [Promethearchaeota archaeon]
MKKFENIGLGGTFDRLHPGHTLFLDIAAYFGHHVHVGLISSSYLNKTQKKHFEIIQNYKIRQEAVESFLSKRNAQCQITKIDSPGMDQKLASDAKLGALVVSQETYGGANAINHLRISKGRTKLTIIIIPRVLRANGTLESSTRLRGEEKGFFDH